ncbi:serine hydrolase domain-containing protein [Saccharothrix sp. ST-888]|uniref:serine hydrolase domain-containing protein n=1 Tax=Saccharothrix sp. ST-888 TaxID=1427391 RepID=UPI0005EC6E0D|nr:serine hydrolase domain-containing protein [Saccharothrix sp. ST-888]KJK59506.1 hypothetical protein UK12_03565 [Saccharothrix sp. ST-888]
MPGQQPVDIALGGEDRLGGEGSQTAPPLSSEPFPTLSPELARPLRPLFSGAAPSSGIAVAVIRGNERTVVCRGHSDYVGERPVRADTRFELGSITKTFTALLLAEMVARGAGGTDRHGQHPAGTQAVIRPDRYDVLRHLAD